MENFLINAEENADDKADSTIRPSPKKLTPKSTDVPATFTITTPKNPNTVPIIFLPVSFSCLNKRQDTNTVKKTPKPLIIEDFTPVVWANPT